MDVLQQLQPHCMAEMTDEQPAAETVATTTQHHTASTAAAAAVTMTNQHHISLHLHCIFYHH